MGHGLPWAEGEWGAGLLKVRRPCKRNLDSSSPLASCFVLLWHKGPGWEASSASVNLWVRLCRETAPELGLLMDWAEFRLSQVLLSLCSLSMRQLAPEQSERTRLS